MSVSYTCPNSQCGVTLKTPSRVQVGKSVKCPKCGNPFVPEPGEEAKASASAIKVNEPPKNEVAAKKPFYYDEDEEEDAESVAKGYGVQTETQEEKEQAEKNKPKFGAIKDKFKKSARGPAMSLLVMPTNLLTGAGLLTCAGGLGAFIYGMWPLVFNDAPPGEEELEEAIVMMLMGVIVVFWGAMVCFGASQMQELSSYPWALIGAIMGIIPLLVGIFAIMMLQNPKVKAGFTEGAFLDDDNKDDDDDEEDEEGDDEEEESGDGSTGKKLAKRLGRGLLNRALGGDGDGDDE